MSSPETIDRQEDRRVSRLFAAARANRASIRPSEPCRDARRSRRKLNNSRSFVLRLGNKTLGIANAQVAGDMVAKELMRREEHLAMQGIPVQHVKDGKPLTAHGAHMLGVAWIE